MINKFFAGTLLKDLTSAIALAACFSLFHSLSAICDDERTKTISTPPSNSQPNQALSTNRELVKTLTVYYLNNQKFNEAEKYLGAHLKSDPEDPDAWRLYGLVLSRLEEWDHAKEAYTKAADLSEGDEKGVNLYLRADVEARSGNPEKSKTTLNELSTIPGFSEQAELAKSSINGKNGLPSLTLLNKSAAEKTEGRSPFKFTAIMASGYDSNVLLLPDFPSGVSPGSAFISPTFQAQYVDKLFNGTLTGLGSIGYTDNLSSDSAPFNNLPIALGFEWGFPGDSGWSLTNQNSVVYMNTDGLNLFSEGTSLGIKKTFIHNSTRTLEAVLPVGYTSYPNAQAPDPTFIRDGFTISP